MVLSEISSRRNWQPREQRLLSEFLAKEYPTTPYVTRIRLGSVRPELITESLEPAERKMLYVTKRWADAIILLKGKTILIEAAIRSDPGDISKLELYKKLFYETPELADRTNMPLDLMLVYAIEDPVVIELARDKGIRCVPFRPPWISDYLKLLAPRERRAPRP